jgi:hypothetical protein
MAVEVADHEPAAVEIDDQVARRPLGRGVEQPRRDRACRAGNRHVADQRQLAKLDLHDRPRRIAPGAGLRRVEAVESGKGGRPVSIIASSAATSGRMKGLVMQLSHERATRADAIRVRR